MSQRTRGLSTTRTCSSVASLRVRPCCMHSAACAVPAGGPIFHGSPVASPPPGVMSSISGRDGGLFSIIEGLLLASLLATATSGVAWLLSQGAPLALDWRSAHLAASRCLIGLL